MTLQPWRKYSGVSGHSGLQPSGTNSFGGTAPCFHRRKRDRKFQCNIRIREATIEDLDAIARVELYGGSWSKHLCEGQLKNPLSATYVSLGYREDESEQSIRDIVGWVAALYIPKVELQILQITVLPEKQGQRIGSCLLHSMIDVYCDKGVESVVLEVRESNAVAIHMYQKAGFVVTGKRPCYYPDGENALLMARPGHKPL